MLHQLLWLALESKIIKWLFRSICHQLAADSTVGTLFQKAVYTVKVLLKMGENVARNM
jgi:hypothetical protein